MRVVAHSSHIFSTAEYLQRIFFPNPKCLSARIPERSPPKHQNTYIHRRYATFHPRSQISPQPQNAGPPRDDAIGSPQLQIQVVTPDGSLRLPCTLRDALASIDRKLDFLVHVGEKIHPQYINQLGPNEGQQDTRPRIPVCKIVSKAQFRLAEATKLKPKKATSVSTKEVEVHWNMAPNDLNHRLERLKDFLDQGRRVEVVFGKKKRKGWKDKKDATNEEAKRLLKQIRDKAGEVDGAKEWKEMEGQVGAEMIMYFEAKREKPEVKQRYEGGYKVKKKFQAAHEEKLTGFSTR